MIHGADGNVVWDIDAFAFLDAEGSPTVHPSLWRQSQLVPKHGLFEVVEGIYQVRSFDLSNMTFVEGDTGVIVIDPLISAETAAAALALYREHRGEQPGDRGHLHALARRPLRRRQGRRHAGGGRRAACR